MVRIPASVLAAARNIQRDRSATARLGLVVEHRDVAVGSHAPLVVTGFKPVDLFTSPSLLRDPAEWTAPLLGGPRGPISSSLALQYAGGGIERPRPGMFPEMWAAGPSSRQRLMSFSGTWSLKQADDMKECLEVMIGEEIGRIVIARRGFYEPGKLPKYHPVAVVFRYGEINILVLPPGPFLLSEDHTFIRGVQTTAEFKRMCDIMAAPIRAEGRLSSMLSFLYHPSVGITVSNRTDNPHDCMRWGFSRLREYLSRRGVPLERIHPRKLPKGLISFDSTGQKPPKIAFTLHFSPRYFESRDLYLTSLRAAGRTLRDLGLPPETMVYHSHRNETLEAFVASS